MNTVVAGNPVVPNRAQVRESVPSDFRVASMTSAPPAPWMWTDVDVDETRSEDPALPASRTSAV